MAKIDGVGGVQKRRRGSKIDVNNSDFVASRFAHQSYVSTDLPAAMGRSKDWEEVS